MTFIAIAIVGAGVVLAVAVGIAGGIDATSVVYLVLIVALGWFAISVARKARRGVVAPRACNVCGGLISSNAPTCKHCGAPQVGSGG